MISFRAMALGGAALALLAGRPARADVPFHKVYLTNGVEVQDLDKFPDWAVLVFPGGPPSGRPVAWPSLVEPGFQTVIDRKTLGSPRLWILPRAALDDLAAAARDNDDQLEGPVADLLAKRGVDCGLVNLQETANLPYTVPERRLVKYQLVEAAPGRCVMKMLGDDLIADDFKRPPSWARFAPRKKKADAGATPVPSASAAPSASAPAPPSAPPSAPPAPSARNEPPVPERAKGCACSSGGDHGGGAALGAIAFAVACALLRRRR